MKRHSLNVLFGQTQEMSTSFQTRQLARALQPWFEARLLEIPRIFKSQKLANAHRLFMNNFRQRFWKPASEFVLYGNDGVIDLRHWAPAQTILYWYDCPWNWEESPPTDFTQGLRYRNLFSADHVFTVSKIQAEMASRMRGTDKRVHYLPVGVDTKTFNPSRIDSTPLRNKFNLPRKTIVGYLGYIGFFDGKVAGQLLLDSAPKILQNSDVHFLIVGFGPGLDYWKTRTKQLGIAEAFTFTGYVSEADVPPSISLMDITIDILEPGFHSLARSETKLKQYMSMGKASIATRLGENISDLDHGRCGLLVEHGEPPLIDAVHTLSKDPDQRQRLGELARKKACEVFDWNVLALKMANAVLGKDT
jgi:glycosyltransferase involved in cell wall biosynthesis